MFNRLTRLIGVEIYRLSLPERLASGLGGFVGAYTVYAISDAALGGTAAVIMLASMGASSVLLFGAPHALFSQPWPVLGGHIFAAVVGVTCAKWIDSTLVAVAVTTGLTIVVMQMLRCIHPPGGATALVAVMGGEAVQNLGYQFVLTPVLLNTMVVLLVAFVFNYPFRWRRYPAILAPKASPSTATNTQAPPITHEEFLEAISELDSLIDVSEQDLLRIYDLLNKKRGS